jgi:hypothetical protein
MGVKAYPFSLWVAEAHVDHVDKTKMRLKDEYRRVSQHSTETLALKRVGGAAHACLFDGPRNVVQLRGPYGGVKGHYVKASSSSARGDTVTFSVRGVRKLKADDVLPVAPKTKTLGPG